MTFGKLIIREQVAVIHCIENTISSKTEELKTFEYLKSIKNRSTETFIETVVRVRNKYQSQFNFFKQSKEYKKLVKEIQTVNCNK